MNKTKIMYVSKKKMKQRDCEGWEKLLNEYAPDLYDNIYVNGEKEAIQLLLQKEPEIVMISINIKESVKLIDKIKKLRPETIVFVMMGMVDDEQEMAKVYMEHGAYKCYGVPLVMDTLVHDMYVSLNIE